MHGWGLLKLFQGQLAEARALGEESVRLIRGLDDLWGLENALICLGRVAVAQEDYEAAKATFEEALAVCRTVGARSHIGTTLHYLGLIAFRTGEHETARAFLTNALEFLRDHGSKFLFSEVTLTLGQVLRRQKDYAGAKTAFRDCLKLCQETGVKHVVFEALSSTGGAMVAEALAEAGSPSGFEHLRAAVELLAAVQSLQDGSGFIPAPISRTEFDQDVAAAHLKLGVVEFERTWAAGRAMGLDQAIAHALRRLS